MGSVAEGLDHRAGTFTNVLKTLKYLSDNPCVEWSGLQHKNEVYQDNPGVLGLKTNGCIKVLGGGVVPGWLRCMKVLTT